MSATAPNTASQSPTTTPENEPRPNAQSATSSVTATTPNATAPGSAADPAATRAQLEAARAELAQVKSDLAKLERRTRIDALLADADTTDLEVARLLTEAAVELMDRPDLKLAIDDLRRQKPHLFRHRDRARAAAMAARTDTDSPAAHAAQEAATSGEKRDLLRYLRLRRKA